MPDSMILTRLEAKQKFTKKKVAKDNDPKKSVNIAIPARTLSMSICGTVQSSWDKAVRDFRDRLRFSEVLAPRVQDIRVSQQYSTVGGQEVISYDIDCIFKPGL